MSKIRNAVLGAMEFLLASRTLWRLKSQVNLSSYDGIIIYNDPLVLTLRLILPPRHFRGIIVTDATEWHEIALQKGVINTLIAMLIELRIRYLDSRVSGVIAISDYLVSFYGARGIPVVLIPPIFQNILHQPSGDEETPNCEVKQLVYAGFPEKKDSLGELLHALR